MAQPAHKVLLVMPVRKEILELKEPQALKGLQVLVVRVHKALLDLKASRGLPDRKVLQAQKEVPAVREYKVLLALKGIPEQRVVLEHEGILEVRAQ